MYIDNVCMLHTNFHTKLCSQHQTDKLLSVTLPSLTVCLTILTGWQVDSPVQYSQSCAWQFDWQCWAWQGGSNSWAWQYGSNHWAYIVAKLTEHDNVADTDEHGWYCWTWQHGWQNVKIKDGLTYSIQTVLSMTVWMTSLNMTIWLTNCQDKRWTHLFDTNSVNTVWLTDYQNNRWTHPFNTNSTGQDKRWTHLFNTNSAEHDISLTSPVKYKQCSEWH